MPRDSPRQPPAPPHESQGFHPGHLAPNIRLGQGDIPWSRQGAQLASEEMEMNRWDKQLWTQLLTSRHSLFISISEERSCSLED